MLELQIAEFNNAVKKFNLFTVQEEHDWRLGTSHVMRNRLMNAAIDNRQAAVRGMPFWRQEDAEKVMHILLALRGLDKK